MMLLPTTFPLCPVCGQPMDYSYVTYGWQCFNSDCPQDAVFSLAAYEADQRARAAYLDSLDNAVEPDDDCEDEQDEW